MEKELTERIIYYLKMLRKMLTLKRNITNDDDIDRMQKEITELIKKIK